MIGIILSAKPIYPKIARVPKPTYRGKPVEDLGINSPRVARFGVAPIFNFPDATVDVTCAHAESQSKRDEYGVIDSSADDSVCLRTHQIYFYDFTIYYASFTYPTLHTSSHPGLYSFPDPRCALPAGSQH